MNWLLVSGDFTPLGGMDAANYALARYLAARDAVHLVTHRAWRDLAGPRLTVQRVPRPLGAHALGAPLLDRAGRRAWANRRGADLRVVVNGGNCPIDRAVVWVHYLHAAYRSDISGSPFARAKHALLYRHDVGAERAALAAASLVVCNSERTRRDVLHAYGVEPARTKVVYYGIDAARFALVTADERRAAKQALGRDRDRPLVGFVGALGDRRKAFDTVFEAWRLLCRGSSWDADLLVVGAGGELDAWRRRAEDVGLGRRIGFAGFRSDVPGVLAALDGLVHPARYEAYGLAPHEALARGVPVLVAATAGVAERYPAALSELLIQDADDAGHLRDRLGLWRDKLESWQALAADASHALRARGWDAMAADIAQLAEAA